MRNAGTIVFNEVFVNENKVYNPKTGELQVGWKWKQVASEIKE